MNTNVTSRIVIVVVMAGGVAAAQPIPAVRPDFGHLAEALTSSTTDDAIQSGHRMFSLPDFAEVCTQAHAADVVKLRPVQSEIRVPAGEPFNPNVLRVLALDASGSTIPRVPIAVETELASPALATSAPRVADGTVTPQRPGRFKLRIRTVCEAPVAEAFITAQVASLRE
jgi:hypothetical protein